MILAGGGGKGAYEVGAWLAMQDMIKEINVNIGAFSGAFVGALNGALFACNSPKEIEKIWSEVNPKKILSLDFKRAVNAMPWRTLAGKIIRESVGLFAYSVPVVNLFNLFVDGVSIKKSIEENGFFSRDGLKEIINDAGIDKRIDSCNKHVLASCYDEKEKTVEYIKIDSAKCKDVLLASSALPIVFGKQSISGKGTYRDGGLEDNLPICPLLKNNYSNMHPCKKYIVIHLENDDIKRFENLDLNGCKLYHIFPEKNLGGWIGMLDFTQKGIEKRKNQAINEMNKQYNYIQETKDLFEDNSPGEVHYVNGKIYNSVSEVYNQLHKRINVLSDEEFVQSLSNGADIICIKTSKLGKAVYDLILLSEKHFKIVLASLGAIMAFEISSAGLLTPVALGTIAPAVTIMGQETIFGLVGLILISKTPKIIAKIRNYKCEKQEDGSLLLVSKKYIDNEIDELKYLYNSLS